ncbi:MAG TPA: polyprenyl synthetase family protein [Candidatus Acidoferrum sp.]|nr:polyprenyl synthetase family protein [Candidatus Acidoferrum sp.]
MLAAETRVAPSSDSVALLATSPVDWKQIVLPLEPFLQAVSKRMSEQISAFDSDLACYAEYALSARGKQLRPALVGLSASAIGKAQDSHVTVAVIIEMVHLATLVHDDVMDEARIRRGRPTLAANWGNELSVLLGDCLFARALELAASFPTPEICRAVSSATNTVCAGEILQTQRRNKLDLSRTEYFKILAMKTGELFALACDLGAHLSGATAKQRATLRQFGMSLGTAYQVYDDCVDVFGSERTAGKSLGTDLAKGKLTLPLLVLLEGNGATREAVTGMVQHWNTNSFPKLMSLLRQDGALDQCREVICEHLQVARDCAGSLPESESRAGLLGLCDTLSTQTELLGGIA